MSKRERIFHAGVKLFARASYDSVGIRDIAREAGVNSAMISYYFKGKSGLLREIFSAFADRMYTVNHETLAVAADLDELCEKSVRSFLGEARENRDLFLIGLRMLNSENETVRDLHEELHQRIDARFQAFLKNAGIHNPHSEQVGEMIFSVVLGAIFSDYLLGGGRFIDDNETVDEYGQVLVDMLQPALRRIFG